MEFSLCDHTIDTAQLTSRLKTPESGAVNIFEGIVRNHNNNQAVKGLFYEAYPDLCENEIQKIFEEVRQLFNPHQVICQHRTGALDIGDTAVWIGVSSAHRDTSFKACRYLIDEIKSRLPIWKKEAYTSGQSDWVNCAQPANRIDPAQYYSRQMLLPEVGSAGQSKLNHSKVLVVGAGGLGSAALMGLAGSGIGTIGIAEFDQLEEHNLHRQHLYAHSDIRQPKVQLAGQRVQALNPSLQIIIHDQKLSAQNIKSILPTYDIILDCTDNFATKFLLNDAAVLYHRPLIQASLYQHDAQLRQYIPGATACLRCVWPELPEAGCIGTCQDSGVFGDVAATMGHLQSLSAIRWLLGAPQNIGQTLLFDLGHMNIQKISEPVNPQCPVCSSQPKITAIDAGQYEPHHEWTADIEQLADETIRSATFIDVRESYERAMAPLKEIDSMHLPCSRFDPSLFRMPADGSTVYFFCAKGIRSLAVVENLAALGLKNIVSLNNTFSQIRQRLQLMDQTVHSNPD